MPRPGPSDREKSNSKLGAASLSVASQSPRFHASIEARTISTFSCGIARAVSRRRGGFRGSQLPARYSLPAVKVWLNGALVEQDEACISPTDRGFLLGDGVFETLRSYAGRLPTLGEHLERLRAGAQVLGIGAPPAPQLERGAVELLQASGLADARIRITVTSGAGPPGLAPAAAGEPTALITASPLQRWPSEASAVVCPWPHNEHSPLAGVKTTSRADTVLGISYAREHGADEAIFLNTVGNLCEATTANVFVVAGQRVQTPPLSAGCLAGHHARTGARASARELGIERPGDEPAAAPVRPGGRAVPDFVDARHPAAGRARRRSGR